MEICVIRAGNVSENVPSDAIQEIVDKLNAEKEAKEEEKKVKK